MMLKTSALQSTDCQKEKEVKQNQNRDDYNYYSGVDSDNKKGCILFYFNNEMKRQNKLQC
jgi:hypothetical protein